MGKNYDFRHHSAANGAGGVRLFLNKWFRGRADDLCEALIALIKGRQLTLFNILMQGKHCYSQAWWRRICCNEGHSYQNLRISTARDETESLKAFFERTSGDNEIELQDKCIQVR
ncbi:hypothetical protein CDAR_525341 [Caerostris darwini]|uniref:LAGLIDADG homing endonuclease n=1 Tax=Caerostris darwini TaxID=1538125 RepID=A0AAV4RP37_9ARAC|nr:hypothetical protein CDAR_525341 [Caerostris darwini]